jgi:hypothetical protein
MRRKVTALVILFLLAVAGALAYEPARTQLGYVYGKLRGGYSVAERLAQYGPAVAARLQPRFAATAVPYPPAELAYLVFKDANILEVYARPAPTEPWRFIHAYPVLKASGEPGPKLREGDRQVPEGLYRAEALNPNSRYHLAVRLDYPNAFDREMAKAEGRDKLGGDIMIHGSAVSIGCLAMGNEAAEDLFVLTALAGTASTRIVVSPTDFRINPGFAPPAGPAWRGQLYENLRVELQQFEKGTLALVQATDAKAGR